MPPETAPMDARLVSTSAERNCAVICEVLSDILPQSGTVLEIGSGTGQHVAHLARYLPNLTFQPTNHDADKSSSITAWCNETGVSNVKKPLVFNLLAETCPVGKADAVMSINVIHIAPWPATLRLLKFASSLLSAGAPLFFYGPFHRKGQQSVESNLRFDKWLHAQNPASGIRNLDEITGHAHTLGFNDPQIITMPSNNLSVTYTKI